MKYVIACDSFKESMSAELASTQVRKAIMETDPDAVCDLCPLADGGEGTADVIIRGLGAELKHKGTVDLRYNPVDVVYGYLAVENTAIIEAAAVVGITLVPREKRRPLDYSSYGLGLLIRKLVEEEGVRKIICGLGGSGTNDGGLGLLYGLGMKTYDSSGMEIKVGIGEVFRIAQLDIDSVIDLLEEVKIEVACDVRNPYVGDNGATRVFGRQKGSDDADLDHLERSLVWLEGLFRKDLDVSLDKVAGTGAAGGIGGGLYVVGAELISGIDLVLDLLDFEDRIRDADYIFTGEGSVDSQTINGKTVSGVAGMAERHGIPLIVLAGSVSGDIDKLYDMGVTSVFSINRSIMPLDEALKTGKENIYETARDIVRMIMV